jgi:putative endopeptidase
LSFSCVCIAALDSPQAIAAWLRDNFAQGQGFLFGFGGEADFKNSSMTIAYTSQGGMSLPEKGYYTLEREDYAKIREAFKAHVQKTLELAGVEAASAAEQAQWVFDFEKRLADASLSRVEMRNPAVFYNPVSLADAEKLTPNFSWAEFFKAQGVAAPEMFSLAQPKFFEALNAMLVEVPVAHWQAYLRFHAIDGAAPYLGDALAEQNFSFYGKTLRGQQEQQPRWKRVLNERQRHKSARRSGRSYVGAFPPESKAQMLEAGGQPERGAQGRLETWTG